MKSKAAKYSIRAIQSLILPLVIWVLFYILTNGRFGGTAISVLNVFRQSVIPLLIGMGLSTHMTMGMWDFSCGAVVFTSAIFGSVIANALGMGIPGLCIFALILALAMTMLSGIIYNMVKVPALVVSIGLALIYESLPRIILVAQSGTGSINMRDGYLSAPPYCFVIFIIAFAVFYFLYEKTVFGHNVRAIGANQKIAYNAGINLEKTKLLSFMFGGLFYGIAAILYMSQNVRVYSASGLSSTSIIFDSMMGIFIAFFLQKYSGFPFGLVIGTITMRILASGLISLGLSTTIRSISTGMFLLIVLCVSSNQGRFSAWRARRKVGEAADKEFRDKASS